jgi:hypothetical protein
LTKTVSGKSFSIRIPIPMLAFGRLGGEAEKTQIFDVLDGRYHEMLPTLIVST